MRRALVTSIVVSIALGASALLGGSASAGDAPDLVGTWTGDYEFPSGTDEVISSTETLVIERQKGTILWGRDQYVQDGRTIDIPVRGAIGRDGRSFTLAEEHGFFIGEIRGPNRVRVWFVRTDSQFTTFEAVLRRS